MAKGKYTEGERINTIQGFEKCDADWYRVLFGNKFKTLHRGFLISWQYRTLALAIYEGRVFKAKLVGGGKHDH